MTTHQVRRPAPAWAGAAYGGAGIQQARRLRFAAGRPMKEVPRCIEKRSALIPSTHFQARNPASGEDHGRIPRTRFWERSRARCGARRTPRSADPFRVNAMGRDERATAATAPGAPYDPGLPGVPRRGLTGPTGPREPAVPLASPPLLPANLPRCPRHRPLPDRCANSTVSPTAPPIKSVETQPVSRRGDRAPILTA